MFHFQQLKREHKDNSETPQNDAMSEEIYLTIIATGNSANF